MARRLNRRQQAALREMRESGLVWTENGWDYPAGKEYTTQELEELGDLGFDIAQLINDEVDREYEEDD